MVINTRRRRHRVTRPLVRTRASAPFDPHPFVNHEPAPDERTWYRDPDHTEWTFVPTIIFVRPIDTVKLLGRDDDDTSG